VRFIKSRRIAWLGYMMWMYEKRTPKRMLEWKPIVRRITGRPRKRWIEDIEDDIQIMGIGGERCVRKGWNGRELLRRLKPTVGCNASRRKKISKILLQMITYLQCSVLHVNTVYQYSNKCEK
jgi:hypothetical protein